jgi:hypothetical protein
LRCGGGLHRHTCIGVNIVIGSAPVSECPAFDTDADDVVTISELIQAVNAALGGCPS